MSDAVDVIGRLVDAFPNGRSQAGRSYIGALASLLVTYPKTIALQCADPIRGVARDTRFLPTVADLVAFCERELAAMRDIVEREDRAQELAKRQREAADAEKRLADARAVRPTYDELKAKYGPNWGIAAAADDAASQNRRAIAQAKLAEANRIMLMREYAAAGAELTEAAPGIPISLTLRRILAEQKAKAADEPD
jgi:hypothetical protein